MTERTRFSSKEIVSPTRPGDEVYSKPGLPVTGDIKPKKKGLHLRDQIKEGNYEMTYPEGLTPENLPSALFGKPVTGELNGKRLPVENERLDEEDEEEIIQPSDEPSEGEGTTGGMKYDWVMTDEEKQEALKITEEQRKELFDPTQDEMDRAIAAIPVHYIGAGGKEVTREEFLAYMGTPEQLAEAEEDKRKFDEQQRQYHSGQDTEGSFQGTEDDLPEYGTESNSAINDEQAERDRQNGSYYDPIDQPNTNGDEQ